jgi:hypothetical protein
MATVTHHSPIVVDDKGSASPTASTFLPIDCCFTSPRPTLPTTNDIPFTPTSHPASMAATTAIDLRSHDDVKARISQILHSLIVLSQQSASTSNQSALIKSSADLVYILTRHIIPRVNVLEGYNDFLGETVDQKDAEIELWKNRLARSEIENKRLRERLGGRDMEVATLRMLLEETTGNEDAVYGESEGGHPEDFEDLAWTMGISDGVGGEGLEGSKNDGS